MKKLMIAAAIVCAAACSEAATIEWSAGTAYWSGVGEMLKTKKDSSQVAYNKLGAESTVYLFAGLDSVEWGKFTTDESIWKAFDADSGKLTVGGAAMTATESKAFNKGLAEFSYAPSISDGAYNYAIAVITHTDGSGKIDAYSASAIAVQGGELENIGNDQIGMKWGLAAGGDNTVWHAAAVPEPTSGLLLLLGVAGLALRRRRA